MGDETDDLLAGVAGRGAKGGRRLVTKKKRARDVSTFAKKFDLGAGAWTSSDSVLESISQPEWVDTAEEVLLGKEEDSEMGRLLERLEKEMKAAAARLDFERAAAIRDRISELQYTTN